MRMTYRVFLSASAHKEDKRVIEWFKDLLQNYNLVPIFAADIPQPRPPQNKIKSLIRDSNGFIGVLTRRQKIEGKEYWKGPDWVQNEVGMAFDADKSIMMFIEKGVDDRGITNRVTDYVLFDRNNLEESEKEIRKALRNFRHFLDMGFKEHDVDIRKLGDPLTNLDWAIIQIGKWLLKRKYKRLDVSLKKPFIFLALLSLIPIFFVFDYFYGSKFVDLSGVIILSVIALLIYVPIGLSFRSRCKECNSYFSLDETPLKTSDLKYVSQFIPDNEVNRVECEVCGHFYYGYRPKLRESK